MTTALAIAEGPAGLQSFERPLSRDLPAVDEWQLLAEAGRLDQMSDGPALYGSISIAVGIPDKPATRLRSRTSLRANR